MSWHKGHGRLERRELVASTELTDFLAKQWSGVAQVFRLTRTVWHHGHTRHEVVYGLTSRSPAQSLAAHILDSMRQHWAIENRLHWRRDVTLGEDRRGVRLSSVAQMLAVLNSVVLSLMDLHQVSNVARQIRRFTSYPDKAIRWLI